MFAVVHVDEWGNKDTREAVIGNLGDKIKEAILGHHSQEEFDELDLDLKKYNSKEPYQAGTFSRGFYDIQGDNFQVMVFEVDESEGDRMNRQWGKVTAVIGAQWGSEGKGVIVGSLAMDYDVHVRVGSPNAGHTFYWNDEKHVQQSIPCGWCNPRATVIIGRGALLNMKQLMKELSKILTYYPSFKERLKIDAMAGILDEKFHIQEGGTHGEMHKRIGSTGEGVGPARVARINRDPKDFYFFKDIAEKYDLEECVVPNTPGLIRGLQEAGQNILLEGSQGSALSLLHGTYPYVTSIDTNVAQLLAEIGIAPSRLTETILVARTYPIRVAGNSGPMGGKEISWDVISAKFGHDIQEKTTVTKKVRRIAEWDDGWIWKAITLNGPTSFAITFMDYIDPAIEGASTMNELRRSKKAMDFIAHFQRTFKEKVSMVATGGKPVQVIRTENFDG